MLDQILNFQLSHDFRSLFRHIIKRLSTVQNPAIYLRGVRHEDIKNILEFMYLGEVSVAQEDLDSFLSVAQDLCIKGLTQGDQSQPSGNAVAQPSQSSRSSSSSVSQGPPTKRPRVMTKNNGETAKNIPKPEPKMEYKPEPEVIDADMDDPQVLEEYDDYYEDDSTPGPSDSGGDKGRHGFILFTFLCQGRRQVANHCRL